MKPLTYILLFLTLSVTAQKKMVLVADYTGHQIDIPDSLSYEVLQRWKYEMRAGQVDFQEALRGIKRIELVGADFDFVSETKKGVIYLNQELNDYPYCKRAAILQELYKNNGGKLDKQTRPLAISKFNVTDKTEARFEKQWKDGYIFTYIIKELK